MIRPLTVWLTTEQVAPAELAGGVAVVIDVLRASTTILHALAAGAIDVLPVASLEGARELGRRDPAILLAGERGGVQIPGFHFGNSPASFTPELVAGRRIVMTTSNGTRAIQACRAADEVLIGCFNNCAAVVARLRESTRPVHLVCAGTDGRLSADDLLFAGVVLRELGGGDDDPALLARALADSHAGSQAAILELLERSSGGRVLLDLGAREDILRAAELDRFDFVPELDPSAGSIVSRRR